ncbi:MAG: hypothetical protein ACE5I1_21945 [bacterium]
MTKNQLRDHLSDMVGQSYHYNDQVHKILQFKIDNFKVSIATDLDMLEFNVQKCIAELKKFKPVASEVSKALASIPQNQKLKNLRDILLDNIGKIQKDPQYFKQAMVINKSVKTMVDMAKVELQGYVILNGVSRSGKLIEGKSKK